MANSTEYRLSVVGNIDLILPPERRSLIQLLAGENENASYMN
jgi:hypothetical protein